MLGQSIEQATTVSKRAGLIDSDRNEISLADLVIYSELSFLVSAAEITISNTKFPNTSQWFQRVSRDRDVAAID